LITELPEQHEDGWLQDRLEEIVVIDFGKPLRLPMQSGGVQFSMAAVMGIAGFTGLDFRRDVGVVSSAVVKVDLHWAYIRPDEKEAAGEVDP
jgi:hypothetical protein